MLRGRAAAGGVLRCRPVMTRSLVRLRHSPMARFLALLAMVAQLGLVVAGTAHQALMLAQAHGDAVEVCTAWGIERVLVPAGGKTGAEDLPSPDLPQAGCAICAASGLLAGPATLVAGVVASAAVMTDIPPAVLWPLAVIAGGGAAGLTKGSTALLRAKSGMATGGLANPVVSTVETFGATTIAVLAIAVPLLCFVAVVALLWWAGRKAGRLLFGRRKPPPPATV